MIIRYAIRMLNQSVPKYLMPKYCTSSVCMNIEIFKNGWSKFARQTIENKAKAIANQFSGLGVNYEMVQKAPLH